MSNRRNRRDSSSEDETTDGYSFEMQTDRDGNPVYIETRRAPDGSYIRTTRRTYVEPIPRRAPPPPPRQRETRRPEAPRRRTSPPPRRPSLRREDRFVYDEYRRDDSEEERRRRDRPLYSDDEDYAVRYDANNRRGQFPAEGFEEPGRILGEVDANGYIVPAENNEPRTNGVNGARRPSQARPLSPLPGPALNDLSESEEEVVVTSRPDGNGYDVLRRRTRPNNDRHRRNGRR